MEEKYLVSNGHAVVIDVSDEELLPEKPRPLSPPRSGQISRKKTFLASFLLFVAMMLNDGALAWIHERVPERSVDPLPDVWFSIFPEVIWAIKVAEILVFLTVIMGFSTVIFHQHRWIATRRIFFICAICYVFRALCISLIQLPVPSRNTYCAPKAEHSSFNLAMSRLFGRLLYTAEDYDALYKNNGPTIVPKISVFQARVFL